MNLLELFTVAFTALGRNVLRSFLTTLGIAIGVAAVIAMVTVAAGAQKQIDEQMESIGSTLIGIWSGSRSRGGVRSATGTHAVLTEADAHALKEEIPEITAAAPAIRDRAQIVYGNQNWNTRVYGIDSDFTKAQKWKIFEGREIDPSEINRGSRVCLIGKTVAEEVFGESNPLGQSLRVNNTLFTIVGVLQRKGFSTYYDQDDIVMVPLKAARIRLLGRRGSGGDAVEQIYVTVESEWMMADVETQITDVLNRRHKVSPGNEAFSIRNMSEMIETQLEARNTFNYLLSAIASVSLIVGGIGIMNIMLVSVTERTREIGLRMAVGAKAFNIMSQFLVEAVALCVFGGTIGVVVALGSSWGIASFAGWPVLIQWYVVVIAVGFSALIGIFFGFYPARKASQQNPIDALRTE